jgi:hypothetical protein
MALLPSRAGSSSGIRHRAFRVPSSTSCTWHLNRVLRWLSRNRRKRQVGHSKSPLFRKTASNHEVSFCDRNEERSGRAGVCQTAAVEPSWPPGFGKGGGCRCGKPRMTSGDFAGQITLLRMAIPAMAPAAPANRAIMRPPNLSSARPPKMPVACRSAVARMKPAA